MVDDQGAGQAREALPVLVVTSTVSLYEAPCAEAYM